MCLTHLLLGLFIFLSANCEVVNVTAENHDNLMQNSRLSFVSFTASWCPHSQNLLTTFTEAAIEYKSKYPDRKTIWGNVDCDVQESLQEMYGINKYPTMKVVVFGVMMMEYRGSRQPQALIEFVEKMENTTNFVEKYEAESLTQWQSFVKENKPTLIVWFPRDSAPFDLMIKSIATIYERLIVVVPTVSNKLEHEEHKFLFSLDGEHVEEYKGSVTNFREIIKWVRERAVDMVRELTFENMEEMVEIGKPMLILFRKKGDVETEAKFLKAVKREMGTYYLTKVNAYFADGEILKNVLIHFNRDPNDLPFLLIDQLIHAYPSEWKGDEIFESGNIRMFVQELLNESHHRRLHAKVDELLRKILTETERIEREAEEEKTSTETPQILAKQDSVFKQLKPAKLRYSFAKEEL